jgi:DNA helicase HerA-like ATPase
MNDTPSNKPIGYINFDGAPGDNNEVEIIVPHDRLSQLRRGQYVLLSSDATGSTRHYLARIIRGPYYVPDAVSKDSAFARASILQADEVKFRPDYHGVCKAEVLGELPDADSLSVMGSFSRPVPQTAVVPLSPDRIKHLLGLDGDMYLGKLTGYPEVRVHFKSTNKAVLPRNLGVFGTVGSGKTNTSQVLIEEAAQAGFAVIVLDVEGEYVEMDKPSGEAKNKPALRKKMEEYAIEASGLKNLQVFHCTGTEPQRADSKEIGIRFANISPYVLAELLELSDVQHDLFLELYLGLERKAGSKPKKSKGMVASLGDDETRTSSGVSLADVIGGIEDKLADEDTKGKVSWSVLLRKFKRLERYGIFDSDNDLGDYSSLMKPQLVSVFDLSGSQNVVINNVLISDILRGLFQKKVGDKDRRLPPTLVVIEEAHTFVSKDNVKRMEETLDILRDISRRGRKRWLGLCFISQQPSHLPPEIYELCNTKVVHQTTGGKNLNALKDSAGGVNEAIWDEVPVLGQGRCLIISPQFRHPVLCDVRPCKTQRKFTE